MSDWKEYKVADLINRKILSIGDGYRAKNIELSATKDTGIPFARVGNINGGFNFSEADFFPIENLPKIGDKVSKVGDTVFTSKGTVGRFAFVDKKSLRFVYSPQLCFWRSLDLNFISPRFLFYWMQCREFFEQASAVKGQTDMADYVNLSDQRQMKITLPRIERQLEIEEILNSLDDKLNLLQCQNRTLEQLAETLFRQWFVEGAEESWEIGTIEAACIKVNSGGTPPTQNDAYYNGDINWYSTKELNDNFLFESNSKITKEGLGNSSAKLFPVNTIVIAIYAAPTVGRLGLLGNEAAFNQAACGLIANEEKICFEYLYLHLYRSRQKLNDMASGSAQQNLNVGIIKGFEIPLPPSELINRFKEQVRPQFQKIKSNTIQIRTLTQLRDTLLPKLMSGEVRVNIK